jgi:adenylate cyclase
LRLLPNIRYGTERYPEKVARRLRALNIATWIGAGVTAAYAAVQLIDPTPGVWKVGIANALIALTLAAIPLLHRFGSMAAPLAFIISTYVATFIICFLLGTGTGMQMYYLVGTALVILFFGLERIFLAAAFCLVAAALVVALQILVPENTGLQPAATQLGNFVGTIGASCAVLFTIVFYAMREVARAEATAEREYERSESLLANILPAAVVSSTNGVRGLRCAPASPGTNRRSPIGRAARGCPTMTTCWSASVRP